jgi:hypothetical protein
MSMTINLHKTVARFAKAVTRRRYTLGANTKGRTAAPTYADTSIKGYVTPVDGHIQRTLPEDLREHCGLVMYTNDDVRTVEQAAGLLPDGIVYGGQVYQCRETQPHMDQGLFRVLALQLEQPGGA